MPQEVLEVLEGPATGRHIPIENELLIGRGSDEKGRLADDPELSRRHARIAPDADGVLTVEDIGSTNGTFVNGERITGSRRLQPGDMVKVGATVMQVLDASGRRLQPTTFSTMPGWDAQPPSQFETVSSDAVSQDPTARYAAPPRHDTPVQPPRDDGPQRDDRPQRDGGSGRRLALTAIPLALLAVVIAVAAVLLLSGGDDERTATDEQTSEESDTGAMSVAELAEKAKKESVEINVSGPRFNPDKERDVNSTGGATGIVVDAKEGLVLTNAHVVSGQTAIKVQLADGTEASATVVGEATCEDLAVIRLRPAPTDALTAVTFADSDGAEIGDRVVAAGYPGAFTDDPEEREFQATEGTLSQAAASIEGTVLEPEVADALQHQAPTRPGMSGGPLLNEEGEVLGLTMGGAVDDPNLNVAISANRIQQLLEDLKSGKNTGYVGWSDLRLLDEPYGDREVLQVGRVKSGSPADKREIKGGELIIELDGTPISSVPEMCSILNSKSSGDNLEVQAVPVSTWGNVPVSKPLNRQTAPPTEKNVTLE